MSAQVQQDPGQAQQQVEEMIKASVSDWYGIETEQDDHLKPKKEKGEEKEKRGSRILLDKKKKKGGKKKGLPSSSSRRDLRSDLVVPPSPSVKKNLIKSKGRKPDLDSSSEYVETELSDGSSSGDEQQILKKKSPRPGSWGLKMRMGRPRSFEKLDKLDTDRTPVPSPATSPRQSPLKSSKGEKKTPRSGKGSDKTPEAPPLPLNLDVKKLKDQKKQSAFRSPRKSLTGAVGSISARARKKTHEKAYSMGSSSAQSYRMNSKVKSNSFSEEHLHTPKSSTSKGTKISWGKSKTKRLTSPPLSLDDPHSTTPNNSNTYNNSTHASKKMKSRRTSSVILGSISHKPRITFTEDLILNGEGTHTPKSTTEAKNQRKSLGPVDEFCLYLNFFRNGPSGDAFAVTFTITHTISGL